MVSRKNNILNNYQDQYFPHVPSFWYFFSVMFWGDGKMKNDVSTDILAYWFPRRAVNGRDVDFEKGPQFFRHCRRARCGNIGGE